MLVVEMVNRMLCALLAATMYVPPNGACSFVATEKV